MLAALAWLEALQLNAGVRLQHDRYAVPAADACLLNVMQRGLAHLLRGAAWRSYGLISHSLGIVLGRLFERRASTMTIDGLRLVNWEPDETPEHVRALGRVAEALALIRSADERRYARLLHDVRRIALYGQVGALGTFIAPQHAIVLDTTHAGKASLPMLALTLVHEATHARVHAAGLRVPEAAIAREERLCVEAEVAFVQRLGPEYVPLIPILRGKLDRPWWGSEDKFARFLAGQRARGMPEWWIRLCTTVFRPSA